MASIKDVSKLAGVSWMTVSRAINTPDRVKPETLKRVNEAIKVLNYTPDHSAQKMRAKGVIGHKDTTIAVLALEVATTPFSVGINYAVEQTANEQGWNSMIFNTLESSPSQETVERVLSHKPAGVVFATMGLRQVVVPDRLKELPLVLANCYSHDPSIPSYVPDDVQGQYRGVRHLLNKGYKKPLFIMLNQQQPAVALRQQGTKMALSEHQLTMEMFRWRFMGLPCDYHDTIAIINQALADNYDFDCLVCGNDRVALVAYMHLHRIGKAIPQDVAILGYDNMEEVAELFVPGLTTIELPHHELGKQAALHIIERRQQQGLIHVPCPLIERESI
ncbi:LacI family DNA-binding transcriptional regulator [Vibrio sp. WXL103]|uniref:LacI family DNA-binding transcriptional regulator n=1 Tax=Vibrio sp. WXL103 TaxID=3450710 RepID=UPI003EC6C26B